MTARLLLLRHYYSVYIVLFPSLLLVSFTSIASAQSNDLETSQPRTWKWEIIGDTSKIQQMNLTYHFIPQQTEQYHFELVTTSEGDLCANCTSLGTSPSCHETYRCTSTFYPPPRVKCVLQDTFDSTISYRVASTPSEYGFSQSCVFDGDNLPEPGMYRLEVRLLKTMGLLHYQPVCLGVKPFAVDSLYRIYASIHQSPKQENLKSQEKKAELTKEAERIKSEGDVEQIDTNAVEFDKYRYAYPARFIEVSKAIERHEVLILALAGDSMKDFASLQSVLYTSRIDSPELGKKVPVMMVIDRSLNQPYIAVVHGPRITLLDLKDILPEDVKSTAYNVWFHADQYATTLPERWHREAVKETPEAPLSAFLSLDFRESVVVYIPDSIKNVQTVVVGEMQEHCKPTITTSNAEKSVLVHPPKCTTLFQLAILMKRFNTWTTFTLNMDVRMFETWQDEPTVISVEELMDSTHNQLDWEETVKYSLLLPYELFSSLDESVLHDIL